MSKIHLERVTKVQEISKFRPTIQKYYKMKIMLSERLALRLHTLSFVNKEKKLLKSSLNFIKI
jgi:hypothetical protein